MAQMGFLDRFRIPDYFDPDEMITGEIAFSDEKCKRCGICTYICPARSVVLERGKGKNKPLPHLDFMVPDISGCVACGCCAAACPEQAISITRGFSPTRFYTHLHQDQTLTSPKRY